MGLFGCKDDGLMETAVRLCWLKCKFFPTPAEITESIKELINEEQTQPELQYLPKKAKWMSKAASKAAEIVREGKAKELLDSLDYSELCEYAKQYFPEISLELVKKNSNEIQYCMEENNRCHGCQHTDGKCHNAGCYPVLRLDKNGWMDWEMRMCGKNMNIREINQRQSA
jgi:hypothetical protein